jgi:hypothetical protein
MPVDEFDRPPLMADAFARRRELEADDEAKDSAAMAPRRPQPLRSAPRPSGNLIAGLLVAGVFAALFAASLFGGPAPETSEPPAAPQAPRFAAPSVAPAEQPAPVAQPTPAPLPTGYIVGTEPAPAQLAPVAPQAAPALAAPPVVYSDLVPLEEPTPIDPMACARRGIGACRGERP